MISQDAIFDEGHFPFAHDLSDYYDCVPPTFHALSDFGDSLTGLQPYSSTSKKTAQAASGSSAQEKNPTPSYPSADLAQDRSHPFSSTCTAQPKIL